MDHFVFEVEDMGPAEAARTMESFMYSMVHHRFVAA